MSLKMGGGLVPLLRTICPALPSMCPGAHMQMKAEAPSTSQCLGFLVRWSREQGRSLAFQPKETDLSEGGTTQSRDATVKNHEVGL